MKIFIYLILLSSFLWSNFSEDDYIYLKEKKEIRMCVDPSWMPFEEIVDGKHRGMVADIYKHFQRKLPIPIQLVVTKTWSQSLEFVKNKKCDILSAAVETPKRKKYLNFTKPFLIFPEVIITREKEDFIENMEDIKNYKIGVVKGSGVTELLRNKYKDINLIDVKNISDGLFKVSSGELYGLINTSASMSYGIAKIGMINLKIASKVDIDYFIKIAVRDDEPQLLDIFNDLINGIDKNDIRRIKDRWLNMRVNENINYAIIYQIILFFLLVLIIVVIFMMKQNRLKKEIEKKNARLNKIIRMSDKQQFELIQLNSKFKKADSAKSEFLAKMSHEIRTPMNGVLGMLYLTQKTDLNSTQEGYISKASSAANSLLCIINDILDFSKIEAGKLVIVKSEFNFNDMIHQIMDVMSFKAQEKGCELLAYYDSNIPKMIKSDEVRIGQILNNLINNAIKFTNHGEVVVTSKLLKKIDNKATIMFYIKDSGIGIDDEGQRKLFKDFSQVDSSITRNFGGTGLGLTISQKLTNLLGGKIWLEESILNIGSTFCFTIKCEIAPDEERKAYLFPNEINDIDVLIIDDNYVACDVLKSMLDSFGFNVDIINSGEEAYENLKRADKKYDLIFLDYKMPKLNGIETYKKIQTIDNFIIPKTIMITAYSQDDMVEQIMKLGIESSLTKPISPSTLYNTILEVLNPNMKKKKILIEDIKCNGIDFNGTKILVAEDNELNQDFIISLLESVNISVDIANDGLETLNLVKSKIYDAVLMDIQMPNMDGLTATKFIRNMQKNDKYFRDLPIIALSANALVGDREKSIEAGMNEHISKPINPNELFETLIKFIKNRYIQTKNCCNEKTISTQTVKSHILNIEEALNRINGNKDVYNKLLQKFIKKYSTIDSEILKLIDEKQLQLAQEKTHELKGISANLGAMKLFDTLILIENILKKDKTPQKNLLGRFSKDLEDVIEAMSKQTYHQKLVKKEFDKPKIKKLLQFIKENIEDDIMESKDKLLELVPYLGDSKYAKESKLLQEFFDEFETDNVIEIVEKMLKDLDYE